jgi:hypothetical protein
MLQLLGPTEDITAVIIQRPSMIGLVEEVDGGEDTAEGQAAEAAAEAAGCPSTAEVVAGDEEGGRAGEEDRQAATTSMLLTAAPAAATPPVLLDARSVKWRNIQTTSAPSVDLCIVASLVVASTRRSCVAR